MKHPLLAMARAPFFCWISFSALLWSIDSTVEWAHGTGAFWTHVVPDTSATWISRIAAILALFVVGAIFMRFRIRHERNLAETEKQLRRARLAWETSYQYTNLLDRNGIILQTNQAGFESAKVDIGTVLGKPLWECPGWDSGPESRKRIRQACEKAASGEPVSYVATQIPPSGKSQEFEVRYRPAFGTDGSVEYIIAEARDITELRTAEREKIEASRMLQIVLDTTPVRFFWKDGESRYLGCNLAFAQDAGLKSPHDIVGRSDFDLVWREQAPAFRADDKDVFDTGVMKIGIEEPITRTDGAIAWIRTSKVPLRDHEGRIIGMLGSYEEISESHRIREELECSRKRVEEINGELERRVRERTTDLVQMNRELETFAHSAAHDLRTPLRAIDGWSHAILEESGNELDETALERLARIRAAAQRIGETLDDLLRLSQVSRSGFSIQDVDLAKVARSQRDMLAAMTPDRRIEWTIPESLPIKGDPELLRLLLWNLLENAVKFTVARDVARIEIGVDPKGLFVRDNGVGFDMAHSGKLFNAFQRLHLPEEFSGTGIGLAVVRRIAERHGGSVTAEGAPGQGATFWFVMDPA